MGTKKKGKARKGGADKENVQPQWIKPSGSKKNGEQDVNGNLRTYFKVFANFRCSNNRCKKSWQSAHAWERENDQNGIDCEGCGEQAELANAVDEILKLDTYLCSCENLWQSIHVKEDVEAQQCDICHLMVNSYGQPQERFGRHYWLKCGNGCCGLEWEDFSLTQQKSQRCTKCYSRGDIFKISKLRQLPWWILKQRIEMRRRKKQGDDDEDLEERPSNHVSDFCDMCQEIRRQGKGQNCRQWRLIKMRMMTAGQDCEEEKEVIVEMKRESDNPRHFDKKGSEEATLAAVGGLVHLVGMKGKKMK